MKQGRPKLAPGVAKSVNIALRITPAQLQQLKIIGAALTSKMRRIVPGAPALGPADVLRILIDQASIGGSGRGSAHEG